MNFLFDIIIIAIIVFTVYRSASRGFVKSVMSILSLVVAFVAAYIFTDALAEIYNESFIFDAFAGKVSDLLTPVIQKTGEIFDLETLFSDVPEVFSDLLQRFGVEMSSLKETFGTYSSAGAQTVTDMSETIAAPVAFAFSKALAFASVFIGALIAMALVTFLVDLVFKLPGLKKANKFFGFLLGALLGLLYAYLFSEVAVVLIKAGIAYYPNLFNQSIIDNSILLKFFSEFSLFSII